MPAPPSRRSRLVWPAASLVAIAAVACSGRPKEDVLLEMTPVTEGVLTVATTLPAPGFWEGDDPTIVGGGFEWGIARALADQFDLDLHVIDVAFADLVSGDLAGADLALAQIEITDERREVLDFSVPYYSSDFGVLMLAGERLLDLTTAAGLSWAAVEGSRQQGFLADRIRPAIEPRLVGDDVSAAEAIIAGEVDAALIDLSSALILAHDDDRLGVAAKVVTGGQYAPALPKGSDDLEVIDAALTGLLRDETVHILTETWLLPLFSVPPEEVHAIPIE